MHVDPGVVEHEFGPQTGQQGRQQAFEDGEIGAVAGTGFELHVEAAPRLPQRIVGTAMQGKRVHSGVSGEDGGGTVPLMDVEIDDQHPRYQPLRAQHPHRHRKVVEEAEARRRRGARVMAAAGEIAGETIREREPAGQHRATDGGEGAA